MSTQNDKMYLKGNDDRAFVQSMVRLVLLDLSVNRSDVCRQPARGCYAPDAKELTKTWNHDTVAPFDLTLKDTAQIPQRPRTDNHNVSGFNSSFALTKPYSSLRPRMISMMS